MHSHQNPRHIFSISGVDEHNNHETSIKRVLTGINPPTIEADDDARYYN